jgi:hypothetical protein
MWNTDFAGLQSVLVDNVLLRCEHEPDGFVVQRGIFGVGVIVANQSLLGRSRFPLALFRFDVFQKRS